MDFIIHVSSRIMMNGSSAAAKKDGLVAFENVQKSYKSTYSIYGKFIYGECMSAQLYRMRKILMIIIRYLFYFMKQHVRD